MTTHWISSTEIQVALNEMGNLRRGHTNNVNHASCPAGEDTRKRLYLTRTMEGTVLAYCHNCSGRGYLRAVGTPSIHAPPVHIDELLLTFPPKLIKELLPTGMTVGFRYTATGSPLRFLLEVQAYFDKWHLKPEYMEMDHWYIGTDGMGHHCVIFPCFDDTEQELYTGCQVRRIVSNDELKRLGLSKMLSFGDVTPHILNPRDSDTVVIVEDRVSGLRVAQAGYASCTMHGSRTMNGEQAHSIAAMFDKALVWYDNDNSTVINNAEGTVRTLKLFMNHVELFSGLCEPKWIENDVDLANTINVRLCG